MRRREFITLLGGAAAWPLAARAQQAERMRRVGMLMPFTGTIRKRGPACWPSHRSYSIWDGPSVATCGSTSAGARAIPTAFARMWRSWSRSRPTSSWRMAAGSLGNCDRSTRSIPLVFTAVVDPVSAGFVASLARPAGNATGFTDVPDAEPGKRVTGAGPHTESLCRHTPKVGEAMGGGGGCGTFIVHTN